MKAQASSCCAKDAGKEESCSTHPDSFDPEPAPKANRTGKIVDHKVQLLIAAGAAMAANCEACLNKIVPDLRLAGVDEADIRSAVKVGQFVKDRPAELMKSLADRLTGTHLLTSAPSCGCPADQPMQDGDGNQG
jgi:alkylhydroperoxidase/carboxymuconolactone decarboxylase family protein YurZ